VRRATADIAAPPPWVAALQHPPRARRHTSPASVARLLHPSTEGLDREVPTVPALTALYYLGLAALFSHEMDAVMHSEWRQLYFLRTLSDPAAYTVFVALHLPAFAAILWLSHHRKEALRGWFRLVFSAFLAVHAVLHFRSSGSPDYEFEGILSNTLIYSAAAFGFAHVALSLRSRGLPDA